MTHAREYFTDSPSVIGAEENVLRDARLRACLDLWRSDLTAELG